MGRNVAAIAAMACGHSGAASTASNTRPPEPTPEALGVTHHPSTRQDIAAPAVHADDPRSVALAHCQQQQRCGFVGSGGRYASTEECLSRVVETQASILKDYSCATGNEPSAFRSCLEDVRTMDCAQPFAEVQSLGHCDTARLCPSGVARGASNSRQTGIEALRGSARAFGDVRSPAPVAPGMLLASLHDQCEKKSCDIYSARW